MTTDAVYKLMGLRTVYEKVDPCAPNWLALFLTIYAGTKTRDSLCLMGHMQEYFESQIKRKPHPIRDGS